MQYSIKKELLESRYMPGYGRLQRCSMISISDRNKTIGKFFHSEEVSFFAYEEEDIRIDYIWRFLRSKKYPIIDQKTNQVIGRYDRTEKTSPWTPYGKLFLADQVYQAAKISEGASLFDDDAKVFTVKVGNYTERVDYVVHVPRPKFWSLKPAQYATSAFEGEVELTGHYNLQLLFAGIFLLQQALEFEDWD